jgi:MoxR-like ATPase
MYHAVIIQSTLILDDGFGVKREQIRQTVIVPINGDVIHYTRFPNGRGSNGAWTIGAPTPSAVEKAWVPVSVAMTDGDWGTINKGETPSVLFQKLQRAQENATQVSERDFADVLTEFVAIAKNDPKQFEQWTPVRGSSAPVIEVVREYASSAPVVSVSAPTASNDLAEWATLLVPTDKQVEGHIERTMPSGESTTQVFDFARAHQRTVAIWGHAGTGKTSEARNYAHKRGLPFLQFECNEQTDEESVQGSYTPTGDPSQPLGWQYSEFASILRQPGVVLLNEVNRMRQPSAALFLRPLEERQLCITRHKSEVIEVHPDCLIIADANPGYRGTRQPDQALLDRFAVPIEFKYDRDIEKQFIPSPTLLDLATQMRAENDMEDKWGVPISTRLLKNFVEQTRGLSLAFAVNAFVTSFPSDEERSALRLLFEANSAIIAEELGVTA